MRIDYDKYPAAAYYTKQYAATDNSITIAEWSGGIKYITQTLVKYIADRVINISTDFAIDENVERDYRKLLIIGEYFVSVVVYGGDAFVINKETKACNSGALIHIWHYDKCIVDDTSINLNEETLELLTLVQKVCFFLLYADVETKIVNRNNVSGVKCKDEKVFSDINYPVEIIDSTYFTTIIRTEGFGVKGHFRLQACGEGMKQRKLIWVNDFIKHGYAREAGKLKEAKLLG